jgi:hypothetical protein
MISADGAYYVLSDGTLVSLPYFAKLHHSRALMAKLNRECKGWYKARDDGEECWCWFSDAIDAMTALLAYGA